jgi:hypothetical protein
VAFEIAGFRPPVLSFVEFIEQFGTELSEASLIYMPRMSTNSSLLCIHRDPAQLSLLRENGYELVTARSGSDGL